MRQVSTDTRVSHHTGYLGMGEDTPKAMCTPTKREMYPKQQGKFLREKGNKRQSSHHCGHTTGKNTFHSLQKKMCEGQICVFLLKKKMLHEQCNLYLSVLFSALVKKKFLFFFVKYNTVRYTDTEG